MNRFQKWENCLGIYANETKQQRLEQYQSLLLNYQMNEDDKQEIMKDVNRTYQEMDLFQLDQTKAIICNVLLIWCSNSLSYRQGMNELVGVLFYTYQQGNSLEVQNTKIESDIYWVFKTIMDDGNHKQFYNYSAKMPIDQTLLIRYIKDLIHNKLKHIDEQLFMIFEVILNEMDQSINIQIFMCLLAREYEIDQIQIIWDKLFEKYQVQGLRFLDAMIITMLMQMKQELQKKEKDYIDGFEILRLYQNFPTKEKYQQMLVQAEQIQKQIQSLERLSWIEIIKRFNIAYSVLCILQLQK